MKVLSKAIAIQLKKKRDLEKKGDTGVYGKKLHANQGDVLNVQDVGKNQTFNQLIGGGPNSSGQNFNMDGGHDNNAGRKHQIKLRRELLAAERAKRRKNKHATHEKNDTISVYQEIITNMGDSYYLGYETSEDDEQDEHDHNEHCDHEDDEPLRLGEDPKVEKLDKEEKEQMMLDDAIKKRPYILSARNRTRFIWDVVIIIFAIVNALTLPMDIAFTE